MRYVIEIPPISTSLKLRNFDRLSHSARGVYVFRDEFGGYLYVGQSKTLRKRILTHVRESLFRTYIASVDLYFIDDSLDREICETILINQLRPTYNRAKVFGTPEDDVANIISEIYELEAERVRLCEELEELFYWVYRGYAGEYTSDPDLEELLTSPLEDDYYEYYTDEDEMQRAILGEDLRSIDRIQEIRHRIRRISRRINWLRKKI